MTNQAGHSPAPWKRGTNRNASVEFKGSGSYWTLVSKGRRLPVALVTSEYGLDDPEGEANIRLIEAAPALLAALKELLEMGEMFIPAKLDAPGFQRARAAIARATTPEQPQ